jgi:hypothetical protein
MLVRLICFFGGFLLSSIFDTTIAEFNEWSILGASLGVAGLEAISKLYYTLIMKGKGWKVETLNLLNDLKLGIIYGLIVDAFKLGS